MDYIIEMCGITKEFPGIIANDDVTLQLKKGEIHALLGENGAGKSTLMSVLFGMYQPEKGVIKKNGEVVHLKDPNDANRLGIGMVHQHFKLVHNFTVLENIILGVESTQGGFLKMDKAREKVMALSERYGFRVDPDALISDISVGMQQRVEILKMLYRENEILIFDEPTAVLTPQEIDELMKIMKELVKEGKSILFITHKLNEIKAVADRCTVLRKGRCIGTVDVASTSKEKMSEMMVGRKVNLVVEKGPAKPADVVLDSGHVLLKGEDITHAHIRTRNMGGLGHIPEDRHRHGLVLDYSLAYNLVLQSYFEPRFCQHGFLKYDAIYQYADELIGRFDIRSGQGARTIARSMSGGNQQKAIVAREIDRNPDVLIAVQPTRGLDVGAIEYIHKQIVAERDAGKGILLVSLELDEVMQLSDRILVIYEGQIVADLDPQAITVQELGLYMAGSKRGAGK